jgi:hypothetical protein
LDRIDCLDGFDRQLFDVSNEVIKINGCISQSAFESETIDFGMKGENYSPTIGMLHFNVAPLAMNFNESHTLESRQYLLSRKERQLHTVNSTTS